MAKSLVVVESPAKAKTINKFLGKDYIVKASFGHIKDLPKNRLGVNIEDDFTPEYEIIKEKKKVVRELKKIASEVRRSGGRIYLAQDPDREGEAIAWHIAEEVDGNRESIYRVLFHEITKDAVTEAIKNPLRLDRRKYNAQVARRVLDRLVGYQVSPILWEKVKRGLSAGRVQSVALRLICEREKEIRAFVPEEYWSVTGEFLGPNPPPFSAKLIKIEGKKTTLKNEEEARDVVSDLCEGEFVVTNVVKKERRRNPPPPFITSTLQQEGWRRFKFSAKKTMMIAQQLYEGIELGEGEGTGLITYMRTDSTRLSSSAVSEVREFIKSQFGTDYLPPEPRVYPNRKVAQDAHEAIRPVSLRYTPQAIKDYLTPDQLKLYELIWNRFLACQMSSAIMDQTIIDIEAKGRSRKTYLFQASGTVTRFPGFTLLYKGDEEEEVSLPPLTPQEPLKVLKITPRQHFTQPPPRYTEGSLVKELEEKGIGRPSTYAVILSTIQERGYVKKEKGKIVPTDLGMIVTELLVENFPRIMDVGFTAKMEEDLDEIEEGKIEWLKAIREFYGPFSRQVEQAKRDMKDIKREQISTDIECDRCGRKMVIRWGSRGRFLACAGYPECTNTKDFVEVDGRIRVVERRVEEKCPTCGNPMEIKEGRFGRFLACSSYPKCKTTRPISTGVECPEESCDGKLVERRSKRGKTFFGCSNYPSCRYTLKDRPINKACPSCNHPFIVEKVDSKDKRLLCPACSQQIEEVEMAEIKPSSQATA